MIANGWRLYYYRIFKAALDELESAVSKLATNDPEGYKTHPKTKVRHRSTVSSRSSCLQTQMRPTSALARRSARTTPTGGV